MGTPSTALCARLAARLPQNGGGPLLAAPPNPLQLHCGLTAPSSSDQVHVGSKNSFFFAKCVLLEGLRQRTAVTRLRPARRPALPLRRSPPLHLFALSNDLIQNGSYDAMDSSAKCVRATPHRPALLLHTCSHTCIAIATTRLSTAATTRLSRPSAHGRTAARSAPLRLTPCCRGHTIENASDENRVGG